MTLSSAMSTEPLLAHDLVPEALPASGKGPAEQQVHLFFGGGAQNLGEDAARLPFLFWQLSIG
jgi:hypothetical protein